MQKKAPSTLQDRRRGIGVPWRWLPVGCLLLLLSCAGCGNAPGGRDTSDNGGVGHGRKRGKLVVFHAASLARPFQELERRLEAEYPGLDIVRESSSSRLAMRKITDVGRPADIIAVADAFLLRQLMFPEHVEWVGVFARNRLVLAYTAKSRYRAEITAENWFEILLRDDVRFGYADPGMAPVGYRTHLCWKLADIHYRDRLKGRSIYEQLRSKCSQRFIRPHCNELIPLLESLTLDYTFQYRSVALQHHLEWLKLPDEIDLGSERKGDFYAQVSVEVPGKTPGVPTKRIGHPAVYGISITKAADNPAMAEVFLKTLFGEEGRTLMEESFQETVNPVLCSPLENAPDSLRLYMDELGEDPCR